MTLLNIGQGLGAGGTGASSEAFPDPFCDIASLAFPQNIQEALRWCLLPGTPIEMADTSTRLVEDVCAGDRVLTRGGTIESVVATGVRAVDEDIVRLCFGGLGKKLPLRLTGNHNVWVLRAHGRKPSRIDFDPRAVEKIPAGDVQKGDFFVAPLPARSPRTISQYTGWLIGMYLAEGCLVRDGARNMQARFTLGADDEDIGVLQRLVKELELATGASVTAYTPPSRPDVRVVKTHDVEMPDWLASHCPGLAPTKRLSAACLGWSDEVILGVLGGWLDGDGNLNMNSGTFAGMSGWTTSFTLAYQLQRLAALVGLSLSLCQVHTRKGLGRHAVNDAGYCLRFRKADCELLATYSIKVAQAKAQLSDFSLKHAGQRKVFVADGYVFRRVTAVDRERYRGSVYSLEIENDHSYIANGVIVCNCEFVLMKNGPYREALNRIVSYFITDIEIVSPTGDSDKRIGREEKQKYTDFLNETLGIKTALHSVALDYLGYGNSFTSLLVPFRRYLWCPKCRLEAPLRKIYNNAQFKFTWTNFEFNAYCPHCGYSGKWNHVDRRSGEKGELKIKRWTPHQIDILNDPYTDDNAFIWRIDDDYRNLIRQGHLFHLERASWELIQAVKENKALMFDKDVIYHMREEPLAGIYDRGWGISRVLVNFTQAWYVQVLHRYNEAIALDYVIPFRVITPMPRAGQGGEVNDPVLSINLGGFTSRVEGMLRQRRKDPARWNVLPFPIEYKALGGDAEKLAPKDLLELGMDTLLNAVGIPVELYKGSLSVQAAPAALRLFEANWSHLVHHMNRFLNRICEKVSQLMSWEPVSARLQRVTHADDLNRQMAKLQLMMGGQISRTTGLSTVGLEFAEEERRKLEEERISAEQTAEMQEEMEQAAQMDAMALPPMPGAAPGAMPPGGAPAAGQMPQMQGMPGAMPGGGMPAVAPQGPMGQPAGPMGASQSFGAAMGTQPTDTPEALQSKAQAIAQQIMQMPEAQKDSALIQLKQDDSVLHALVKSQLDEMKRDAQLRGGEMILQSEYGKQAGDLLATLDGRTRVIEI